jgi:hypothetical protein
MVMLSRTFGIVRMLVRCTGATHFGKAENKTTIAVPLH